MATCARTAVLALATLLCGACTEWGQGDDQAPSLYGVDWADAGGGKGGASGVVAVEGWTAPVADAAVGIDAAATTEWDVAIVSADIGHGGAGVGGRSASDVTGTANAPDSGGVTDSVVADSVVTDSVVADSVVTDSVVTDSVVTDSVVTDSVVTDSVVTDGAVSWPDAGWGPDWSGYPDAQWPGDADIYGGVITSCFNAYAYVFQEACTGANLTTACVDGAAQDASYYTQFLFQPVRECANALCVPQCQGQGDGSFKCIEACLGKNCVFPLFACLAQGESGANDCPATFSCLKTYEDKIFSIATKCFANATVSAQGQLSTFFSCGQAPQTDSCFDQIALCYGSGTASCLQTIQCSDACPPGDESCGFGCIGKASPKAQSQLDALWDCINEKCKDCEGPNGCGDPCNNIQCNAQQVACVLGN